MRQAFQPNDAAGFLRRNAAIQDEGRGLPTLPRVQDEDDPVGLAVRPGQQADVPDGQAPKAAHSTSRSSWEAMCTKSSRVGLSRPILLASAA